MIGQHLFGDSNTGPIVILPTQTGDNLANWAKSNQTQLRQSLTQSGALLFRNYKINGARHFEHIAVALGDSPMLQYSNRSTPRSNVQGKVYTSTEYPSDQVIPLHNENAYTNRWAKHLFFFCLKAAEQGGETPIADSRRVYQAIPADIREKFERKKVMYVRNYGSLDLSWQEVFQTDCQQQVDKTCQQMGIESTWHGEGKLTTRQVCQSTVVHPQTNEKVWFNQAHLFHVSNLGSDMMNTLLQTMTEQQLPRNAYYGDGSAIEPEVLEIIRAVYEQQKITFSWQSGDLLLLDNLLFCHGRNPYSGDRKVLVAMSDEMNGSVFNLNEYSRAGV